MANPNPHHLFITILLTALFSGPARSHLLDNARKLLDDAPPDLSNKCGSCPCNSTCNYPPPVPSPPPPPPPSPPPPIPMPQPPPTNYCPPPPYTGGGGGGGGGGGSSEYPPNTSTPPYIYINGPPGNLYPVDANFSGSGRISPALLTVWVSGLVMAAL